MWCLPIQQGQLSTCSLKKRLGIKDYKAVILINPKNSSLYEKRAQVYYEQGQYGLASTDYKKMIFLKPGDVMGYMGLGRNANTQKLWDEAILQFNHAIKLESEYSPAYSFRAEAHLALEKWNEATDDIVTAMKIDRDRKAGFWPLLSRNRHLHCLSLS